ncbi:MAG: diguanylate cyclase [Myxococcota bacterium]
MSRRTKKTKKNSEPVCTAATQIIQMAMDEDCSASDLGRIAASDPAFGLRVLRLVNSPSFMLANKVEDVRRAVALLGVRGLRNLALSLVVSDMVPVGEAGQVLLGNSLRRAMAARSIATSLDLKRPDNFFTAGLLLESGLLAKAREHLDHVLEVAKSPAEHRIVRERAAGKLAHPIVGAELAQSYRLSEEMIFAIAHHHDSAPPEGDLAQVCWLAERVAGVFEGGDMSRNKQTALQAAGRLGVTTEAIERLLEELPQQVAEAARGFDHDIGEQPDLASLVQDANRSLVDMNHHYEGLVRQLESLLVEKEALEAQLRAANQKLAEEATTDVLTGLANKRALEEALARDLARASRMEQELSLVVVDVDHFKQFNDRWGHSTGDEVLRAVGQLLRDTVRTGDVAARYGGEEFVLVLPNTDPEGALTVAERVRSLLEEASIEGPEGPLRVTASFGVATVRGPGCEHAARVLFERADAALYEAKRAGRNRVRLAA